MLKKVVAIGPESTGKSTLCEELARHYNTSWCPEYAREYLLAHGNKYAYEDLLVIARGQLVLEDEYVREVRKSESPEVGKKYSDKLNSPSGLSDFPTSGLPHYPLFIDTDMYVMKVWSEFVYNKCDRFILEQIVERKYDLYLFCNVDLPWTKDELREYPDLVTRERLYHIYKDLLVNQSVPWVDIHGDHDERLQIAVNAVDGLLKS